jgi:hypothetical protein
LPIFGCASVPWRYCDQPEVGSNEEELAEPQTHNPRIIIMKSWIAIFSLLFAASAFAQDAAAPKPAAKPELKPESKVKHGEYVPPAPMDDMAWAMQFDKNHDGVLDEAEKTALQDGWKLRQQKFTEFRQWEREFREKGYQEEKEFQLRQEKERKEFQEKRKKEYLDACQRFGVPPPKEENRKEWRPEKGPAINKGELKPKEGKPEGIKAAPMPE